VISLVRGLRLRYAGGRVHLEAIYQNQRSWPSCPVHGEVQYEPFKSSGVNHISTTKLDIPAEKMVINGENKDYTIRVD